MVRQKHACAATLLLVASLAPLSYGFGLSPRNGVVGRASRSSSWSSPAQALSLGRTPLVLPEKATRGKLGVASSSDVTSAVIATEEGNAELEIVVQTPGLSESASATATTSDQKCDMAQPTSSSSPTTSTTTTSSTSSSSSSSSTSPAAQWHKRRRSEMLQKYSSQIAPLERNSSSHFLGLSLLLVSNISLFGMAVMSGRLNLHPLQILLLAAFPGSMFSLWTLQILHDALHGSLLPKRQINSDNNNNNNGNNTILGIIPRKKLQQWILFWGSMPSAFGYYLYLQYGHLTHHKSLGDPQSASLKQLFDSPKKEFEDGDVLFVAHRMKLKGEIGPTFKVGKDTNGNDREITMSISKSGFNSWKEGKPLRNALCFTTSFMYERFMLVINDIVVAITGHNFFFPNKPREFHEESAKYCRCAVLVRALLWKLAGWKSMLFLYLAETVWSIPPHPACAMFVTNHGSNIDSESGDCIPSSSTYAGKWYSVFTLGTNYHCEHHDFPTIPLHRLGKLREIAPEYYREGSKDNVFKIMWKVFSKPEYYACMDVGVNLKHTEMVAPAV